MTDSFVHLRVHTEYSVEEGAARLSPGGVAERAAELGIAALGIADLKNLFGALKFYGACRAQGVKPLIGCEMPVGEGGRAAHLLLFCANGEGYRRLNRLISRAYAENNGAVKAEWLAEDNRGLIALSGGPRGEIGRLLGAGDMRGAKEAAGKWKECFSSRFYVEIWRADEGRAAAASVAAAHAGAALAAAHPAQCAREKDLRMLDVRRCIAHNWLLRDAARQKTFSDKPYLLSAEEMRRRFADIPEALENSAEIARRCNFSYALGRNYLPKMELPRGETPAKAIIRMSGEGLLRRMPSAAGTEEYQNRLRGELEIINQMGFADYYLIVADFVGWAKAQGIPVGPGRGSGAGSLAAFALGITDLDPVAHGLLFERFLNPERVSLPDFDIDFCVDGRDRVIEYVAEKYGAERVAQIVTFGQIGARSAVRDVGRVLAYPYKLADRIARMIPGAPDMTIAKALAESEQLRAEEEGNEEVRDLLELSREVEGLPRNIGTHAGGVLIAPEPIVNFCPLLYAADTNSMVSQMDMNDVEKIGLVKFDFLGLKTLTILAQAELMLKNTGAVAEDFSLENIPMEDAKTYRIYGGGELKGVFQCESRGMRDMMRRVNPDRFGDIVALIALYRPGPMQFMDAFIEGKHGLREITYPHPELKESLEETYGVWVYQEQVMETARRIAGYSLGDADLLRRAMGKKKPEEMQKQRQRFIDGAAEKMPQPKAAELFDKLAQFAEYGFPKAHAAAYAVVSYRTAYLKAHYPAALYAAAMSADSNNGESLRIFANCARAAGVRLSPPDINAGRRDFYLDGEGGIVYGLKAVKGIGGPLVDEIVKARGSRPFANIFDFCRRTRAVASSRTTRENLILAGAFDRMHKNRAAALETLPVAAEDGTQQGKGLFGEEINALVDAQEWDIREILINEQKALGFALGGSFYSLYRDFLRQINLRPGALAALPETEGKARIAGIYNGSSYFRRRGLAVISLEDESTPDGEVLADASLLEAAEAAGKLKKGQDLLVLEGAMEGGKERGRRFRASRIFTMDGFIGARARRLAIRCGARMSAEKLRQTLSPARAEDGDCEVLLDYDGDARCRLSLGRKWRPGALLCDRLRDGSPGVLEVKVEYRNAAA
ncbi:MAG: DNA polymerase III subunit alpha [Gammaproteobacteria bacterium]